ncbi:MAG: flippase [Patescibacteria group bacterium]|nr:flippase [Patescibacteria group bacterium]MDD5715070.1 flippase [Patescibacteria group bacterium]
MVDEVGKNDSNSAQERILKNTGYLTAAFVLQKILSFLYFIYIARQIGPVDLGLYDPAKSLIPIFLILIDFSLSTVLVREISRKPERTQEYLSNVLGIKIVFAFVIILGMGIFTNFSGFSPLIKTILYLDAIIVALDTFTLTLFAVFRGQQNMKFEAIGMIITQLLTIIFGVVSLKMNWGLQALFIAVVVGSVFNFLFSYSMVRRKIGIRVWPSWNINVMKMFLKIAIPFAITAIFVKLYTYTDRFMLLKIAGQGAVGWYVTAHKLTYALEFIPSAFAASIFPAMSAFYVSSKEKLAITFQTAMKYLMIISIPISVGAIILADKIILKVYGTVYETSILPWRILMIGLLVIFCNFPVGAFLNACNRQVINTINMGITVVVNLLLNIYFIQIKGYSFTGAALAALISGVVLFLLGLWWIGKIAPYNKALLLRIFLKSATSSACMALLLWFFRNTVSIFLLVPIGMLAYLTTLYVLRGYSKQDILVLMGAFTKKKYEKIPSH